MARSLAQKLHHGGNELNPCLIWTFFFLLFAFPGGSIGEASILLFWRLAGLSPTQVGRLVADARDQQPFEPGEWGLESCSLRAFLQKPPCGTCKKDQACIELQDY